MLARTVVLTAFCLLVMAVAVDAGAACKVCFPTCTNVSSGLSGRTTCTETSTSCTLTGSSCTGGAGNGCECGTMGCGPCDATCAPDAPQVEWKLARVEVTTPVQQPVEWRLVSVTTKREGRS